MAQLSYPGVYVEEVPSGVRPIAAASTSIAAFIGVAERGQVGEAVKVFNFTEYQNRYGGFLAGSFLSHAVYQFFNNGGTQCYVVRVAGANAATANIVLRDRAATNQQASLTIFASSPGAWGNQLAVVIANGTNDSVNEFNLAVFQQDELTPLETLRQPEYGSGHPELRRDRHCILTLYPGNHQRREYQCATGNQSRRGSAAGIGGPKDQVPHQYQWRRLPGS